MKQCWICNQDYDTLSDEHIIPRHFGGSICTKDFSCMRCNQKLGTSEAKLSPLSIFMRHLDNADGEPTITIPQRGSRDRKARWPYGEDPTIELSTTGHVKSGGWERPPGKKTFGDVLWIPGQIPIELSAQDLNKSMLKAIMAQVCHANMPKGLFGTPLAYLAGNDEALHKMQPTSLDLAPREVFARVWLLAPPMQPTTTIYGFVAYGMISRIYKLCDGLEPIGPFCREVKAYSHQWQLHGGEAEYIKWWITTLEELTPRSGFIPIGRTGPYAAKQSRQSNLTVLEASPAALASRALGIPEIHTSHHPLEPTHGIKNRFQNWLRSIQSEETHAQFLADARKLDETRMR